MSEEPKIFKKYLLGDLDENETTRLELQIISDADLEAHLIVAEESLIEDYLDQTLSAADLERFRSHFLISDDRENRIREVELLRRYAERRMAGPSDEFKENVFRRFARGLREVPGRLKLPALGVATILLVVVVFAIWQFSRPSRSGDDSSEIAVMNTADLSDLSRFPSTSAVTFFGGSSREAETTKTIDSGSLSANVIFRIGLPPHAPGSTYAVKIAGGAQPTLELQGIRAYTNPSGEEVRIIVPSKRLPKGRYNIDVISNVDPAIRFSFPFLVE